MAKFLALKNDFLITHFTFKQFKTIPNVESFETNDKYVFKC